MAQTGGPSTKDYTEVKARTGQTFIDADGSRIPVSDGPHYTVLVVHIFAAAVALVLGPPRFVAKVRARKRSHRAIGRTCLLAGVLPSALATVPVALWSGRLLTRDRPVDRGGPVADHRWPCLPRRPPAACPPLGLHANVHHRVTRDGTRPS